jgi:hypothetical protein
MHDELFAVDEGSSASRDKGKEKSVRMVVVVAGTAEVVGRSNELQKHEWTRG